MEPAAQPNVTRLLRQWKQGDHAALNELMPMVEAELRRLAGGYMRNERPGHTLQPTALVSEAWLRLAQQDQAEYEGRSHFVAIAAGYMRQILVEYARKRNAEKRSAGARAIALEDVQLAAPERAADLIALDDALYQLARLHARQAQIVDLHFFGGLTYEEIAEFLSIGRSTVIRDLRMAQLWLRKQSEP